MKMALKAGKEVIKSIKKIQKDPYKVSMEIVRKSRPKEEKRVNRSLTKHAIVSRGDRRQSRLINLGDYERKGDQTTPAVVSAR